MKFKSFCVLVACLVVRARSQSLVLIKPLHPSADIYCTVDEIEEIPRGPVELYSRDKPLDQITGLIFTVHNPVLNIISGNGKNTNNRFPREIFTQLTSLKSLVLANARTNMFTKDDLTGADELLSLNIGGNEILEFPANIHLTAPRLEELNVEFSRIKEIKKGALKSSTLKKINLDSNLLTSFNPAVFAQAKNLEVISLSSNAIKIVEAKETELPQVTAINLAMNELKTLPMRLFRSAPNLAKLELNSNQLVRIIKPLKIAKKLKYLDLSSNRSLKDQILPNLHLWPQLKVLRLTEATQSSLIVEQVHDLEELYLSYSELKDPKLLTHLKKLEKLRKLIINDNEFTKLDDFDQIRKWFPNLEELWALRNKWNPDWLTKNQGYCDGVNLTCHCGEVETDTDTDTE